MFKRIRTSIAILLALVLALVIIILVSESPLQAFYLFLLGPLRNFRYIGNVIELAIPLIFSGLATAILFRSNLFNLGAEGIFYISGLAAAVIAIKVPIASPFIHPLLAIITGTVVGMMVGAVPGYLKAKLDASELVSSLMLNSILAGVGLFILNHFIRDKNITEIASLRFPDSANLPRIIPGTRIHFGIVIALVMVLLIFLFFKYHKQGYLLKMFGLNRHFTEFSGFSSSKLIILAHLLAGALAGMGGSIEVLGMHDRFRWADLPGLGFDGALVAMLAQNNPVSVLFAALFLAYIRTGADIMARQGDVANEMVYIIQAVII
ncbi:MAG: ABC transporter permease, partial [Sphaerochaetaceae bacterium]